MRMSMKKDLEFILKQHSINQSDLSIQAAMRAQGDLYLGAWKVP